MKTGRKTAGSVAPWILSLAALPLLVACGAGGSTSDRQAARSMVRVGDHMLNGGEAESAAGFYRSAAERDPTDPEPRMRLAALATRQGDTEAALRAYLQTVASDPSNAEARRAAATILLARGDASGAALAAETLAPIAGASSRDARALRLHGVALDLTGQQAGAEASYRRGIAVTPADPDLRANLALSLAVAGNPDGSVEEARRSVGSPTSGATHRGTLVLVLAMAGRDAEAAREAASLPGDEAEAIMARGRRAATATDASSRAAALGIARARGA